jgi:hypothetical protein
VSRIVDGWVIEQGVPIPPRRKRNQGAFPGLLPALKALQPGESLLVTYAKGGAMAVQGSTCFLVVEKGYRFTRRSYENGDCRVWRLKDNA